MQVAASKRPPIFVQRFLFAVLFLLAGLPVLCPILLILKYGVDVPYWDEWNIVDVVLQVRHGGIPPSLFAQHNEHRIVIPRLIYLVLDNLSHWNQFVSMFASLCIVFLTSVGIYVLSRFTIPPSPRRDVKIIAVWFLCNLLIFGPLQCENWLWAVGLINFLPMAFIVWGMVVLCSSIRPAAKMGITMLLATAATFSVGGGVLAWPLLGLLWLWARTGLKKKIVLLLIWCAGFGINILMYFHHYIKPGHAVLAYSVNTHAIFLYVLAFLGAPFGLGTQIAPVTLSIVIGALLLALLSLAVVVLVLQWCADRKFEFSFNFAVWFAVAGFAVGSGVMAGPTRAGFGPAQALASRYYTFSIYLAVALLNLSLMLSAHRWFRQKSLYGYLVNSLVSGFIVLYLLASYAGILSAREINKSRMQAKAALMLIRSLPNDDPNLAILFPIVSQLRDIAESVNKIGFIHPGLVATNHAREIQIPADWKYRWHAEGHLDQAVLNDPDHLVATGWAVVPNRAATADAIFLTYDHFDGDPIIFALATLGSPRQDVADLMHQPNFELSGWVASCPTSRLPVGGPLHIRAWSFILKTGKAEMLGGVGTIQR